jgi:uncharacterized membrane protein
MSALSAPISWPAPPASSPAPGGLAPVHGPNLDPGWCLRRNCALTPRQLGAFFASICALSLAIGVFFFHQGATWVVAFSGLEMAALGLALLCFARHARDGEQLTLVGRTLTVEQQRGSRHTSHRFNADWLSVTTDGAEGLLRLSGEGRELTIGRHLRPALRPLLAQDLRRALARARQGLAPEHDPN